MQANNGGSSIGTNGTVQCGYVNSTGDVNAQYNSTASNAFSMDNGSWWANNTGDSSQTGNAYVGGQVTAQNLYAYNETSSQTFSAYQSGSSYWDAFSNGDSNQTGNSFVSGQVSAGNIYLSGSTGTNNPSGGSSGYLGFENNPNVSLGGACGAAIGEPGTALAADAQGQILKCYGGTWQAMGGGGFTQAVGYQTSPDNSGAFGWFKVCVNDGFYGWGENADVYPAYGPNAQGQYYWEWYNYHLGGHGMVNTIYCFN